MDKICDNCACYEVCIYANPNRTKDCTLWEPKMEWIPVTERLPEIVKTERAWKNVYRKSGRVLCACKQADGKRFVKEGYMEFFNDYPEPSWKIPGTIHSVTHWMPLPEPPSGERRTNDERTG